jgi:predicted site-specific integrase-resolvase
LDSIRETRSSDCGRFDIWIARIDRRRLTNLGRDVTVSGCTSKRDRRPIIGYARVSTTDQDLDIQVAALKREGCTTIRSEERSGTTTEGRAELKTVLDFLREGDVLMVTRIDRLARSVGICRTLSARSAPAGHR